MSEINDTEELPEGVFTINLKLIDQYQQKDPSLKAIYKLGQCKKYYFPRESSIHLNLITCEYNIFILSMLQRYIIHWYYIFILHPGMDRTETIFCQHLYCPRIINSVWKEVTNCGTCQHTKWSNKNMLNYQIRNLSKYHGTHSVYI